jgi:cytochrome c peroxidase
VGKLLYFDTNLSSPPGQSCASCHSPDTGFSEPHATFPVSQGANPNLFGNRNSPTAAYAAFSPDFHLDEDEGIYEGGQFWDGRAKNLEEQAKGPFLNPLEMGMEDEEAVIAEVRASSYADLFEQLFGEDIWNDVMAAYDAVASAIAEFERSDELNRFTSKYDYYLAGKATLTDQEQRGLAAFEDETRGNCAACHPSTAAGDGTPPLFTDFTYDNLGVPRNPDNPFYDLGPEHNPDGEDFVDLGLGGVLEDASLNGLMKVPTLRNVGLTAPYMHNGVFATLEEVVLFYSTRDVGKPDGTPWAEPEVAENVNDEELGDLGLTDQEVEDIVAFMRTLTDGYAPSGGW